MCLTLDDSQEILWSDISSSIVNLAASVDILSIGFIEDLSWEWVLRIVSNVIIGKSYDVLWVKSMLDKDLIGMANVSLMSIVAVPT